MLEDYLKDTFEFPEHGIDSEIFRLNQIKKSIFILEGECLERGQTMNVESRYSTQSRSKR